jgi:enoyl-CoA hydratase
VIEQTTQGDIAVLRLAHGKANALDVELCRAMTACLRQCRSERAIVITGTGRIFSAGVDLLRIVRDGAPYVCEFLPALIEMFETVFQHEQPIVAAINGAAIAGGCVLACAADRRMIVSGATIGIPELRVGVPFPAVALEIMRNAAAPPAFERLVMRGEVLSADASVAANLAEIHEGNRLIDVAVEAAAELAALSPNLFALTKRQLRAPAMARIRESAAQFDAEVMDMWARSETIAAIEAYIARTFKKPSGA